MPTLRNRVLAAACLFDNCTNLADHMRRTVYQEETNSRLGLLLQYQILRILQIRVLATAKTYYLRLQRLRCRCREGHCILVRNRADAPA